jgi:hypothetical protein
MPNANSADADTRTLVTFLLDETGSMESIKDDTIGGFNSYLSTLKASKEPIDFTLLKFDSRRIEKVCVAVPVADVAELDGKTYRPGATTPLIDAAYKTIKAVEKSLNGSKPNVIVCIQTDGHENASTEHGWDELNALIKEKTAAGWQFNFLGTGIDAYDTGARMGVAAMNTMSTGRSAAHVRASYAAVADSCLAYARGEASTTEFSMTARAAAGDQFYDKARLGSKPAAVPQQTVSPAAPPQPKPRHQAVDDFALC